ncbi:ATP-binding protein [Candidatus Woesearchaeota archaeon]|nr:ATP-binding protein [Candidatus Woesearchaeota archaeon]
MELSDLERWNPWWKTGQVKEGWLKPFQRDLYHEIQPYLDKRQILLLQGLRRVGKTTLLFQIIAALLKITKAAHILYFSFDEQVPDIREVLETYQKFILGKSFEKAGGRLYLFLDEVQKVADWENKVKVYYDLYPNLKIFLSGSASVRLRRQSKESLAGRIFDFTLEPLSFQEFLILRGVAIEKVKASQNIWAHEVMPHFYRYIKYGSFPELVHEENEEIARKYIYETVIERIIYKDLPEEFPIKDIGLMRALSTVISQKPCALLNFQQLSRDLGKDSRTISSYFDYLQFSFLVRFLFNYRGSPLASMRKAKKVYFATPNIIFACNASFEKYLPAMLENVIVTKTNASFFYANGFEVDIVLESGGKLEGIEIKTRKVDVQQLKKFAHVFGKKVKRMMIVCLEDEKKENGIPIIPAWKFLLR